MKARKWTKSTAASALIAPLVLTTPAITQVTAEGLSFHDWISMQLGDRFEIGETITLDLTDYFGNLEGATFMVINHNHQVAVISIKDGEMTIDGRNSGSTMVDLLVDGADHSPANERFRLHVDPAENLTDEHGDGLGIDDIIRYIRANPQQTFRHENLTHLLHHVTTIIQPSNRPPEATDEPIHLSLQPGGEFALLHLHDFFYDPDGDQLQFSFAYDDELVEVQQDEHMVAIGGYGLIGTQSTVEITARDEQSGRDVSKALVLSFVPGDFYSPPEVLTPIPDQTAREDSLFTFTVPQDTFSEATEFDHFTYLAALDNGDSLPSWLTFDPQTLTFSGVPMQDGDEPISGPLGVRVTALSNTGESASTLFQLNIMESDRPIALYEEIHISMDHGQSLGFDLSALFDIGESEAFDVNSVDGQSHWSSPDSYLLGDFYQEDKYFSVLTSGGIVTGPDSFSVQFQAKGTQQLLSSEVDVTVTLDPLDDGPIAVQAGMQVSLSSLMADRFKPLILDSEVVPLEYYAESNWIEVDPDNPDLLYISPEATGTIYMFVTANGLDGAITLNQNIELEVIPDDGG